MPRVVGEYGEAKAAPDDPRHTLKQGPFVFYTDRPVGVEQDRRQRYMDRIVLRDTLAAEGTGPKNAPTESESAGRRQPGRGD